MHNWRSRTYSSIALMLLSIAGTISLSAMTKQDFANRQVAVTEETLAPGESEHVAGDHPSVVVYLSGESATTAFANGTKYPESIVRGKTMSVPARASTLTNTGRSPLRLVRVAFLTSGSKETWGMTGLPPNYKILFEDQHSRTYDIRIPAHGREPRHTHHDRVVVCLSGAVLEHVLADGRTQPSTLKTDEVAWRVGQTHEGRNLGDTNLWVIAIEPK